MESWWQPIWRFLRRLLLIEGAICLVCAAIAVWRAWGLTGFGNAVVTVGLALGAFGVLPLFFRTSSIRARGLAPGGAFKGFDLMAEEGASMLPGGVDSLLRDDVDRVNTAIPSAMLLIAVAALSFVVAFAVSFF
ncbi:MAG: hypothetical protein ACRDG3_02290 [Tepidiformaceae bacterium]